MKPLNSNNCNPQKRLSDMMAKKSENSIDIYYTIYQEFFLHAENPSDLLKQVLNSQEMSETIVLLHKKYHSKP